MDENIENKLKFLGFKWLLNNWDSLLSNTKNDDISYLKLITQIINSEYEMKKECARLNRIKNAKIPQLYTIETYPFNKQPKLKKQKILSLYDSLEYAANCHDLIFVGPTGCGKTGLAVSFLVNAINHGFTGLFIEFPQLIRSLYQSRGDRTEQFLLKKLSGINVLLIDEIGYDPISREQAGIFAELLRKRHNKSATILTTQLGFEEWNKFLLDKHITAALIDRLTVNCTVFNMSACESIRVKNVNYGVEK